MFEIMNNESQEAIIKVVGVGGCGSNAVDHMILNATKGVEFICINTDAQALKGNRAPTLLQLGAGITRGLGAGANPEIGREAALEDRDRIAEVSDGSCNVGLHYFRTLCNWSVDCGSEERHFTCCSSSNNDHHSICWNSAGWSLPCVCRPRHR